MTRKKSTKRKKKPEIFAVPKDESSSNKHEVVVAISGDLNKGKLRKFSSWPDAVAYAHRMGIKLGANVLIHDYDTNPTYETRYRKAPRITPRMPRLR